MWCACVMGGSGAARRAHARREVCEAAGVGVAFVGVGRAQPLLVPDDVDQLALHVHREGLVDVVTTQRPHLGGMARVSVPPARGSAPSWGAGIDRQEEWRRPRMGHGRGLLPRGRVQGKRLCGAHRAVDEPSVRHVEINELLIVELFGFVDLRRVVVPHRVPADAVRVAPVLHAPHLPRDAKATSVQV